MTSYARRRRRKYERSQAARANQLRALIRGAAETCDPAVAGLSREEMRELAEVECQLSDAELCARSDAARDEGPLREDELQWFRDAGLAT